MVASIVLTGKYNVGISESGKVKIEGNTLNLSDIPFVRYRFPSYGPEEIQFIQQNKAKFKGPVHLAEVELCENIKDVLDSLDEIENLAKYLYVTVDDEDMANGLKESTIQMLKSLGDAYYDRIIIRDKCSNLYPLAAERLKNAVEEAVDHEFRAGDMGVCGSSILSFCNGREESQACLTAVWARKIMAEYAESDDCVPSASQEKMTTCGCIQYFVVSQDISAPASNKGKTSTKEPGSKSESVSKPKGSATWLDM